MEQVISRGIKAIFFQKSEQKPPPKAQTVYEIYWKNPPVEPHGQARGTT